MALMQLYTRLYIISLLACFTLAAGLNVSGEAITRRYWDCCKPSCGWTHKAALLSSVKTCAKNESVVDRSEGTGCNGGNAFPCSNQQPWAVNDTFAYGFVGAFLMPELSGGQLERSWCCACYQLDFKNPPLQGKTMIVQASNTAYDITTANQFTFGVSFQVHTFYKTCMLIFPQLPGGNVSDVNACGLRYGVDQSVFGELNTGVSTREQCDNLPEVLRSGCQFRFDWLKDDTSQTYVSLI